MSGAEFLDFTFNGIVVGSILTLAAVGLTLVYGILDLSNFAHGDFLTLGAYFALTFAAYGAGRGQIAEATLPPEPFAIGLAVLLIALVVLDALRWRRLRRAEQFIIAGAGVGVLLIVGGMRFDIDPAGVVAFGIPLAVAAAGIAAYVTRPDDRRRTLAAAAAIALALAVGLFLNGTILVLSAALAVVLLVAFGLALEMSLWRPLRAGVLANATFVLFGILLGALVWRLFVVAGTTADPVPRTLLAVFLFLAGAEGTSWWLRREGRVPDDHGAGLLRVALGALVAILFTPLLWAGDGLVRWVFFMVLAALGGGAVLAFRRAAGVEPRLDPKAAALVVGGGAVGALLGDALGFAGIPIEGTLFRWVLFFAFVAAASLALGYLMRGRRHIGRANVVTYIIATIGLALAIRSAIALRFGTSFTRFPGPIQRAEPLFAGITATQAEISIVVIALVNIALVHVLLQYTKVGKAMRALRDNMSLARVSGIDVDRVILYVWVVAMALTALAGVLLARKATVAPELGWNLLLYIFASVILGGIGSAYGAMIGGFSIGLATEWTAIWAPEYKFAVAFGILIVMLLFRPQGVFGGRIT